MRSLSIRLVSFCSAIFLLTGLLVAVPVSPAAALAGPQTPATEAVLVVLEDGKAPLSANTYDGTNFEGQDSEPVNDVVRNFDFVTYSVEVSLNDADDTNLRATVTLNDKAKWTAVPLECRTQAIYGASVVPNSQIFDMTGDGLEDTLVCNLGDQTEGTKIRFKPVAQAVGNNDDVMQVSVVSNSDNNTNTGCEPLDANNQVANETATTQCEGPQDTLITANFGINIDKSIASLAPEDEIGYSPKYFSAGFFGAGSEEGKVVEWHLALNYNTGSEFVVDDGAGRQSFTLTDTWAGTHSDDASVEGDNVNGDFDDKIKLEGDVSGNPLDNCEFVTPIAGATVACFQDAPGEPITIQINDVPTNQIQLAKVEVNMFYPFDDLFDPNGFDAGETYTIDNTVTLTGWGGVGTMVTSVTGNEDPGPESATNDYLVSASPVGRFSFYKTFDRFGSAKTGQRAGARGETIETSLAFSDARKFDTEAGMCDTIDTDSFEFGGHIGPGGGQRDARTHGGVSNLWSYDKVNSGAVHRQYNPVLNTYNSIASSRAPTVRMLDGAAYGVTVEYSDISYAATGDDHWTATCEDDLDGNGTNDWVDDYTVLPGGTASVTRVRVIWDRNYEQIAAVVDAASNGFLVYFSFDLVIKDSAPIGSFLPNAAATYTDNNPSWEGNWAPPAAGLNGLGNPSGSPFFNVEDDPANALFSFSVNLADRVLVLPASMAISKQNDPVDRAPVASGDPVSFTIDPRSNGSNLTAVTMTFEDTLPDELSYVSDDCAVLYQALGLTCTAVVVGQTITWTVPGYQVGDDLPAFTLDAVVNKGTESGTYINEVTISSDFATFTDDSHCATAVSAAGVVTASAQALCRTAVTALHSDVASVNVVAEDGFGVSKTINENLVEPRSDFVMPIVYENFGGSFIGAGHLIDILPYNGDGDDASVSPSSPERWNSDVPGNANVSTSTADADGRAEFVSISGTAGETFEYATTASALIDNRPCHPSNWPVGVGAGDGNVLLDDMCTEGLVDLVTDVPTPGLKGTGSTNWSSVMPAREDITAVRVATPDLPAGTAANTVTLVLNTDFAVEDDLLCNNVGANAGAITLDIVSADVCVEVVAGDVGDYVWFDDNRDGVQNGVEDPLENIRVDLLDSSNNPLLDEAGDPIFALTDEDGLYLFTDLPVGTYTVQVDTTTLPTGFVETWDADHATAIGAGGTGHDNKSTVELFGPGNPDIGSGLAADDYDDVVDDLTQDFGYDFPPDIALTKLVNADGDATFTGSEVLPAPGVFSNPDPSLFSYQITIDNESELAEGTGIEVTDIVPPGVTVTAASPAVTTVLPVTGAAGTGTPIVWDAGTLTPEASATLTVTARVTAADFAVFVAGFDTGLSSENVAQVTDMNETDLDSTPDNAGSANYSGDGAGSGFVAAVEDDQSSARVTIAPAVGDYVWHDLDADGVQEAGEPGIEGVNVTLFIDDDGTPGQSGGDTDLGTVATGADGSYYFGGLTDGGEYYVQFDHTSAVLNEGGITGGGDSNFLPTTQTAGADTTVDSDGDLVDGFSGIYEIAQGEIYRDFDQGYYQTQTLGNRVFFDADGNGKQDAGDDGIGAVTVELRDAAGDPFVGASFPTSVVTDGDGFYLFTDLPPGDYTVFIPTQAALTDHLITGTDPDPNLNGTDQDSHGATTAGGWVTQTVTLSSDGEPIVELGGTGPQTDNADDTSSNLSVDFGFTKPDLAITLTTPDNNTNGAVPGTPAYGPGDDVNFTITIFNQGGIDIFNLDLISYIPDGFTLSPNDSNGWVLSGTDLTNTHAPTIPAGTNFNIPLVLRVDPTQPAAVGTNTVLVTEVEIVEYDTADGTFTSDADSVHDTDSTDDAGASAGTVNSDADDAIGGDGTGTHDDGVAGTDADDHDPEDILVQWGTIGDTIWADSNGNGVQDGAETGIVGVTVNLLDALGDPVLDSTGTAITAVTGAGGTYSFTYLALNTTYRVEVDTATLPVGVTQTFDSDGINDTPNISIVTITTAAPVNLDQDFGYAEPASVGDFVWEDTNKDGVQDLGEPAIPNVTINLLSSAGNPVTDEFGDPITTDTDSTGLYQFSNVPPGDYQISVNTATLPTGYGPTFDLDDATVSPDSNSGTFTLASGDDKTDVDFGFVPTTAIAATVWFDTNNDGIQDAGEAGIIGATVNLLDSNGDPVLDSGGLAITAITDGSGNYTFIDLAPGDYQTSVDTSSLPADYVATFDLDDGTISPDSNSGTFSLAAGDILTTADFGFVQLAFVGDYVWNDVNADGVQDAGEPAIPNVTINLLDSSGNPVTDSSGDPVTAITDSNGLYTFTDLMPGDYQTSVDTTTLPAGYSPTFDLDDGIDSPDNSSGTFTLAPGDNKTDVDFGYIELATFGSHVWVDTNGDGIKDTGETGIAGVTINLLDSNGDPVLDSGGNPITATTDSDGYFQFTGLTPGDYQLEVDAGTLPANLTITFDLDDGTVNPNHNSGTFTLAAGNNNFNLNFGYNQTTPQTVTPDTEPTTRLAFTGQTTINLLLTAFALTTAGTFLKRQQRSNAI